MSKTNLEFPKNAIADFCRRWDIVALDLFGSVLRPDFDPHSDVDFLVTFVPDTHWTLLDCVRMAQERAGIIGRPVDLVSRHAVEQSVNPIRRRQILESAEALYGAR